MQKRAYVRRYLVIWTLPYVTSDTSGPVVVIFERTYMKASPPGVAIPHLDRIEPVHRLLRQGRREDPESCFTHLLGVAALAGSPLQEREHVVLDDVEHLRGRRGALQRRGTSSDDRCKVSLKPGPLVGGSPSFWCFGDPIALSRLASVCA